MQSTNVRSSLTHTRNALKKGRLTIGFLGGSITENRVPHNWPEVVTNYFLSTYTDVMIEIENAAIGATGSDLGLIRVQNDIKDQSCDLVFIEYSVNDFYTEPQQRRDQMEGLIRRLKQGLLCDIVIVHTYLQEMYQDLVNNRIPPVIADYEQLADYYGLNSVYVGKIAFNQICQGQMRFEEWLPDGLHPQYRGSLVYGNAVIDLIKKSIDYPVLEKMIPIPLSSTNWESAVDISLKSLIIRNPFFLKRCSTQAFVKDVLFTAAIGATIEIPFEGRGLLLVFDFGSCSSEFRYSIDGNEWQDVVRDRPTWCNTSGWLRPFLIGGNLPSEKHIAKIEVTHGNRPECKGTNFELTHLLAIK